MTARKILVKGGTKSVAVPQTGDTLDASGKEVTNAADPTSAQSLATRAYVLANAGAVNVKDEGTSTVNPATALNFTGAGVTVTNAGGGQANIAIPGGGGSDYSADYAAAVIALSPNTYWRLNETSGTTAADSSGNGRDGTYAIDSGSSGYQLGVPVPSIGGAVAFNNPRAGVDSTFRTGRVQRTYSGDFPTTTLTIMFWTQAWADDLLNVLGGFTNSQDFVSYAISGVGFPLIISNYNGESNLQLTTGEHSPTQRTWTAAGEYVPNLRDGVPHLIGVTLDGTNAELFVDGYSGGTKPCAGSFSSASGTLWIGRGQASGSPGTARANPFGTYVGILDEFALFGTVLTASNFANLYTLGCKALSL